MTCVGAISARILTVVAVGCTLLLGACAVRHVRDYVFDVTGFIRASDGSPLQDVEVVLQVDTPIYEGVTPVKIQRVVTSKGAFIFRCLGHSPVTNYTITVRKDGFEPQTMSGKAPPDAHLSISLKRIATS